MQVTDSLTAFGRYGYRDADIFDQPPLPLPSGGGGNAHDLRHEQAVRHRLHLGPLRHRRCSKAGSDGRAPLPARIPLALGTASAFEAYGITGLPTDPRLRAACRRRSSRGFSELGPAGDQPAVAVSGGVESRRSTTRGSTGRHSLKTGYEFQHIATEVQDVNPLYGRDAYSGQFSRPAGAAAPTISTTWPISCSVCAASTRSATS